MLKRVYFWSLFFLRFFIIPRIAIYLVSKTIVSSSVFNNFSWLVWGFVARLLAFFSFVLGPGGGGVGAGDGEKRHFVQANEYYTNQELERWALFLLYCFFFFFLSFSPTTSFSWGSFFFSFHPHSSSHNSPIYIALNKRGTHPWKKCNLCRETWSLVIVNWYCTNRKRERSCCGGLFRFIFLLYRRSKHKNWWSEDPCM